MMNQFDFLKKVKGMTFSGIYGDMLHTYKNDQYMTVIADPAILCFWQINGNRNEKFWHIKWQELRSGDDALIVTKQDTPVPLKFEETEMGSQKYLIHSASFSTFKNKINNVWGYGFTEEEVVWMRVIIIELEDSFIHIQASPAMEYKVLDKFPVVHPFDELLVTTEKE
ncbi:hypothetical protein [Jeotgalibacillus malaysiensis]|uniref:hypothetical protein n=1 Tax=Jeotgalibacillus malaysiensis TaxID=1508404 RepID=UPI00384C1EA1